jgi:hypothetical protein
VPALPSSVLEPLWVQFAALLPARQVHHPLGCHRPRVPDRVIFNKLIQVLVLAAATAASPTRPAQRPRCAAAGMSGSPWGVADRLRLAVLGAYQRLFGLELAQLAVDGCTTKAPCGGQVAGPSPVDRRKQGLNARWSPTRRASRWVWWQRRPTAATTGCWPPPSTP